MKIAFVADLHIGAGRSFFSDLQSDLPYYLNRHKTCFLELIEQIKKEEITYVILGGDLLDHARPLPKESELLGWFLHELSEIAEVHIISGNHETLWGGMTALHPVQAYTQANDKIKWHLSLETTDEPFGKVLWASHHETPRLGRAIQEFDPEFVVAHFAAKGCVYHNGITAPKGFEFKYKTGKIKRWFVGDIHLRQQMAPNAAYPGSPLQINFGESGVKGFDVYDTEKNKLRQVALTKTVALMTEFVNEKVPEFSENALYRVFVSKEFLSHTFPKNVVSVQLISKKESEETAQKAVLVDEIDFGDPLAGLEETLSRTKLPESIYPEARQVAASL
jgi:DNA repair exonuclease SbcCD nuclease subunit